MTTVGYGDWDHSSGLVVRGSIVMIILIGSFTSSLVTLTIVNFFKFTPSEAKAFLSKLIFTQLKRDLVCLRRSVSSRR